MPGNVQEYESMRVVDLKAQLKQRGLPTAGLKAELVARLQEASRPAAAVTPAKADEPVPAPTDKEAEAPRSPRKPRARARAPTPSTGFSFGTLLWWHVLLAMSFVAVLRNEGKDIRTSREVLQELRGVDVAAAAASLWAAPRQWVPEALTLNLHHAGPGGTGGNILVLFCALLLLRRWLWQYLFFIDGGRLDESTLRLLEGSSTPPAEVAGVVGALNAQAWTEDEATCADEMRCVMRAAEGHGFNYSILRDSPATLLRCSPHFNLKHGALCTRFTVQYNLYGGSIVALGDDSQREALFASHVRAELGCFSFTECGAGVISGAGVETTATYDKPAQEFVIHSPTPSSRKTWISQGMFAEHAVILAELVIDGERLGPHLFWARIAKHTDSGLQHEQGVEAETLPPKTALRGLDNAYHRFEEFRVPRSSLLSRFCSVSAAGEYELKLPQGVPRMVDLLISRLLTGRIQLSESTVNHAMRVLRQSWAYADSRELWRGSRAMRQGPPFAKPAPLMSEKPLIRGALRDYSRSLAIVANFIASTREKVAVCVQQDRFPNDTVEMTCMCKFVGTGFAVDALSACRKIMGARALQAESGLGIESFVANATCAAEGDNTIMELKIVSDVIRGRTSRLPLGLLWRLAFDRRGRRAISFYVSRMARALLLWSKAVDDGQLLKDVAWARMHMRVLDAWLAQDRASCPEAWLESYEKILMQFPVPVVM